MVNTRGDRQRDCRADDRLMYALFTVLPTARHDGQVARIKERYVDNAVGFDGQRRCWCARQPEVQSKQSGRTGWSDSDDGRGRCAGGTSVKSCETDRENGYEN